MNLLERAKIKQKIVQKTAAKTAVNNKAQKKDFPRSEKTPHKDGN